MNEQKYNVTLHLSGGESITYNGVIATSIMDARSQARQASVSAGDKFASKVDVELVKELMI
jgi:hypothetical protein